MKGNTVKINARWALVGLVVLAGCSAPKDVVPADLEEGDCFTQTFAESGQVSGMQLVSCSTAHDGEVITVYQGSAALFDISTVVTEATLNCPAAFTAYVGGDPTVSDYSYDALFPTQDQWNGGQHTVVCYVYDPAGKISESLKGAGA